MIIRSYLNQIPNEKRYIIREPKQADLTNVSMVKNSIKIFARLKRENSAKSETIYYHITKSEKSDIITFRANNNNGTDVISNKPSCLQYRFCNVFDEESSQEEIFARIAQPVVASVINGFNGTIFAYGQTGSGKTYAITGSSKNFRGRGIIPRSIENVFTLVKEHSDNYTISISYLEIYNEIGYDLLNPKQQISSLEELPKVMLLEDGKGESHLRNLSVQRVATEEEAMRLLYLGDTNRTMAETPMNVYSSRSHCIFTINITWKNDASGKIRRSKLNLVDLAGSERIKKTNITGTTLMEAKYINLSLHYLEQVVTALSQKKTHIPFRNSMLTYMLRDSLSGNCLTVLLATLATNKKNFEETAATCKFAQRVADLSLEAVVNQETEPKQEIEFLRSEIEQLQKQIVKQTKYMVTLSRNLSKDEKEHWTKLITTYLNDNKDDLHLSNCDFRHIQYCFKRLKQTVQEQERQKQKLESAVNCNNELIDQCKNVIEQKEKEIHALKSLLFGDTPAAKQICSLKLAKQLTSFPKISKENVPPIDDGFVFTPSQKLAFQTFMENPKNTAELDFYKQSIEDMYKIAGNLNLVVEQCQKNIINKKSKLYTIDNEETLSEVNKELMTQQTIYRNSLSKLQSLKAESQHFKSRWEKARSNVIQNFANWCNNMGSSEIEHTQKDILKSQCSNTSSMNSTVNSIKLATEKTSSEKHSAKTGYSRKHPKEYLSKKQRAAFIKSNNYILESDVNKNKEIIYTNKHFSSCPDTNCNVQQLKSERPYSNESNKREYNLKELVTDTKTEGLDRRCYNNQNKSKSRNFSELPSIMELTAQFSESNVYDSDTSNSTKYQSKEEIDNFFLEEEEQDQQEEITETDQCSFSSTGTNCIPRSHNTLCFTNHLNKVIGESLSDQNPYTSPVYSSLTKEEKQRLSLIRENYLEDFDKLEYEKLINMSRYPSRTRSAQVDHTKTNCYEKNDADLSRSHLLKSTSYPETNANSFDFSTGKCEEDLTVSNLKLNESYESEIFHTLDLSDNENIKFSDDEDFSDKSDSYKTANGTKTLSYKSEFLPSDSCESSNSIEFSQSITVSTEIAPVSKVDDINPALYALFLPTDSQRFKNFIKHIPLTGDMEVDEEIIKFYRAKFVYIIDS